MLQQMKCRSRSMKPDIEGDLKNCENTAILLTIRLGKQLLFFCKNLFQLMNLLLFFKNESMFLKFLSSLNMVSIDQYNSHKKNSWRVPILKVQRGP